jgi:choice-of-anchor A domain-containing protein
MDYASDSDFGITTLSLGDFTGSSDTQGRLYVCGDAHLKSYSVSDGLPPSTTRTDLFVGGDLDFASGRIIGGNVVYGGDATLGNSVAQGMYNRTITQQAGFFPCQHASTYYKAFALNIGTKASTGSTELKDDGTFVFTRQGAGALEIFDFECSLLPKINKMVFRGIPAGQTIVVNWRGETCNIKELNIVPINPAMVIFNFPDATKLNIKTSAIEASVLAPFAAVKGSGGYIRGMTVVGSWEGSTQQNYLKCEGCLNTLDPWAGPAEFLEEKF